jgi:uncharacterized membrane protein YhhN
MNTLTFVFLGVFTIISILELIFAFTEQEKARKIIKPFCMLSLIIMVMVTSITSPLIYLGCAFGMIGDIFLIKKENKYYFGLGTIAFLVGHLLYISEMLLVLVPKISKSYLPWQFYLISIAIIIAVALLTTPISYKVVKNKLLALLGSFYLTILASVTGFAIYCMCLGLVEYLFLVVIGGILFLSSDTFLIYVTFIHDVKRRDFYVMLTYLSGQVLIVFGLLLTVLLLAI